jgi:hypothetical protein
VDPSLQWGLLGAGVGAGGSALKSLARGDDIHTLLRRAALTGILGAGLGGGVSAGTRLLGYKPVTPNQAVTPKKTFEPSASGAVGLGIAGATGLGALSEVRRDHLRNQSVGDFFYGGDAKSLHEGDLKTVPAEHKTIDAFLKNFRKTQHVKGKQAPITSHPGFLQRLRGDTNYSHGGMKALEDAITKHQAAGKAPEAVHLKGLLEKLHQGDKVMDTFKGVRRPYIDPLLEKVSPRNPMGLLGAAGVLGLGHLAASTAAANMASRTQA